MAQLTTDTFKRTTRPSFGIPGNVRELTDRIGMFEVQFLVPYQNVGKGERCAMQESLARLLAKKKDVNGKPAPVVKILRKASMELIEQSISGMVAKHRMVESPRTSRADKKKDEDDTKKDGDGNGE